MYEAGRTVDRKREREREKTLLSRLRDLVVGMCARVAGPREYFTQRYFLRCYRLATRPDIPFVLV